MCKQIKTFKHSGNLGDIIYSLPTIIALGGGMLYVGDGTGDLGIDSKCPLPSPLTQEMVSQIIELLKLQPYLTDVKPYHNEKVDYNLDKFREHSLWFIHLAKWHLKAFGAKFNLARPWLENITPLYVNDIIINRSDRYPYSSKFDWGALNSYKHRCAFIGFEEEYKKFIEYTGLNIVRYHAASIVEFARAIKGSKLYIGNQSLGFALAEALKHPRVLEVRYLISDCMPQSINGYIQLDKRLLKKLIKNKHAISLPYGLDNVLANIRNFLFHLFAEGPFVVKDIKRYVKKYAPKLGR